MATYHVVWEIDVEADSPREAAVKAREYQTRPDTTAVVFDVHGDLGTFASPIVCHARIDLLGAE